MPNPLVNVQLSGSDYDDDVASIMYVYDPAGGTFEVTNGNFYYQLVYGERGGEVLMDELLSSPGPGVISPEAIGVRFRNADPLVPATVSAVIVPKGKPTLALSSASPLSSSLLVGVVAADGSVTGGSGFAVTKGAAGVYTVAYTTAFSATPAVVTTPVGDRLLSPLTSQSAAGFAIMIRNTGGTATDAPWSFLAQSVH